MKSITNPNSYTIIRADRGSTNLEYNYDAICNKCFKTYNKSYTFSKT